MTPVPCTCGCPAIILTPRTMPDLDRDALVALAVFDAYGDLFDGLAPDPERHLPALARHIGEHQHEEYRHSYMTAAECAGRHRSLYEATSEAAGALDMLALSAGIG